ncbi:MAG: septal ring lytic transglycosylase RlpA family protein [Gammaproteobacteria bacterium]|nr:septal ring lytic transglycosylase RlpA family protein [Gammaproteobacteria bacterium]
MRVARTIPFIFALALLAGCSARAPDGTPSGISSDGAPDRMLDPKTIVDAVPRHESPSRYGNPDSYVVFGKRYHVMTSGANHVERGIASWYGTKFHGRRTSSGEPYDMYAMTAAHKSLPLPTYVKVTNLRNHRTTVVKVNDRGPFHDNRIIDLSYAAATKLGVLGTGTGFVEIQTVTPHDPESANPLIPVKNTVGKSTELFVQVGAFSSHLNADRLRRRLQSATDHSIRIQQTQREGQEVYRVQVGPISSTEQADSLSRQLSQHGVSDQQIVIE